MVAKELVNRCAAGGEGGEVGDMSDMGNENKNRMSTAALLRNYISRNINI